MPEECAATDQETPRDRGRSMHEEWPTTELPGGPMRLFVAAPDAWPPGHAVIVIQEWWD
jgi:hypothetical protein